MTLDRMKLSAQTVRKNIAFWEEVQEHYDTGYYLQLEHEKFVLECIEKQIPKKPTEDGYYDKPCVCSYCGQDLNYIECAKYCKNCGQALDWSDT